MKLERNQLVLYILQVCVFKADQVSKGGKCQRVNNKDTNITMYASAVEFVGPVGQSDIFYECPTKNVPYSGLFLRV